MQQQEKVVPLDSFVQVFYRISKELKSVGLTIAGKLLKTHRTEEVSIN